MSHSKWLSIPAVALGLLLAMPESAQALRPDHCPAYEEREVSAGALTEQTYRRLERIYEEIGDEEYAEAEEGLRALLDRRLDDYERATVYQALGHVAASRDRMDEAIRHFERSVELNRMPNNVHFEMILQMSNLNYAEGNYREALDILDDFLCQAPEDKFNSNVFLLKAGALSELDEFADAIVAINTAIDLDDDPREQWYALRLGLEFELERYRDATETLHILIGMNPDSKQYWTQLSAIHLELDEDQRGMVVLKLAYRKGLLDRESEYRQLASLLQAHNNPYRAAQVLSDAINDGYVERTQSHWEQVAGAWYEARELDNALSAYGQAAELSDDGRLYLQRAHILANQEDWEGVSESVNNAIDRGGLTQNQEGNANVLLGTAEYNLDNLDRAERAFNAARNFSNVQETASQWLNHIQNERGRRG